MTSGTETQAAPAETKAVDEGSRLAGALSKLVLASIGAVSLAEETAEKWLHRLAERGESDVQHARGTLSQLRARGPHLPQQPVVAIGSENLASKSDMEALKQQVAALSAQVAQLNKRSPGGE
jgi:polyhydroxyalkanoate synthesis regulator phasin